jgi:hypothetical protein
MKYRKLGNRGALEQVQDPRKSSKNWSSSPLAWSRVIRALFMCAKRGEGQREESEALVLQAVEAFINDLAQRATTDRDGLLSHLSTYAKTTEVNQ